MLFHIPVGMLAYIEFWRDGWMVCFMRCLNGAVGIVTSEWTKDQWVGGRAAWMIHDWKEAVSRRRRRGGGKKR